MNFNDEERYLNQLVNRLMSGRLRLVEDDQDVTQRELGHLAAEVEAIEAMLRAANERDREFG